MIPYGHQDITQADIDAVVEVLRSDFLTQGPAVPRFERDLCAVTRARFAVAVNSATSALHVACLALELGPGDVLWTVPNTFVASANCARYCGASVDFVDIDPVSWNMDVVALRAKLADARRANSLPKVVVPVHFAGQPTQQEEIWELARDYGFRVLEDASHSVGAARSGEPVGSCQWSDVTVLSFHPVKIITSGEGGAALTNDSMLAERMAMLRTHGITRDRARFQEPDPMPWHYEQLVLGFNYRMTDIQAALGASQLARLASYVRRRNELAGRYNLALRDLPLQLPTVLPQSRSAFHLYVVRIAPKLAKRSQRQVYDDLQRQGIGANVHYMPVHLQPYYARLGFARGQFPEAEAHAETALTIPLFPSMTDSQQDNVIAALQAAL